MATIFLLVDVSFLGQTNLLPVKGMCAAHAEVCRPTTLETALEVTRSRERDHHHHHHHHHHHLLLLLLLLLLGLLLLFFFFFFFFFFSSSSPSSVITQRSP